MAPPAAMDSLVEEHDSTIDDPEQQRVNPLKLDFVNNVMVTVGYNNGSAQDAMKHFTTTQTEMNEDFQFIAPDKLSEALRNLPTSLDHEIAVRVAMRATLQLRHGMYIKSQTMLSILKSMR